MTADSFTISSGNDRAANYDLPILQVGALPPDLEEDLEREFQVIRLHDALHQSGEIDRARIEVAVTSAITGVKKDVMDMFPDLRAVINLGVGYDSTDSLLAKERGIAISNTPDVLTDCVADLAIGLLIDVLRRVSEADRFVRAGSWPSGNFPLASRVSGKRIGIIGLGRIGRAIARRLEGFNSIIAYHNRQPIPGEPYEYVSSVERLAEQSDVLIVALSAGPGTESIISRDVLNALGTSGYLVNISRGSVIDEQALIESLRSRTIAGAGLDVFADEPHVPDELWALDNVVLLPHIGSATFETRAAMKDLVLQNLRQFSADGTLTTPVF